MSVKDGLIFSQSLGKFFSDTRTVAYTGFEKSRKLLRQSKILKKLLPGPVATNRSVVVYTIRIKSNIFLSEVNEKLSNVVKQIFKWPTQRPDGLPA